MVSRQATSSGPAAATGRPSRNDPCWCGSGQKYKRCHADADAEEAAAGTRLHALVHGGQHHCEPYPVSSRPAASDPAFTRILRGARDRGVTVLHVDRLEQLGDSQEDLRSAHMTAEAYGIVLAFPFDNEPEEYVETQALLDAIHGPGRYRIEPSGRHRTLAGTVQSMGNTLNGADGLLVVSDIAGLALVAGTLVAGAARAGVPTGLLSEYLGLRLAQAIPRICDQRTAVLAGGFSRRLSHLLDELISRTSHVGGEIVAAAQAVASGPVDEEVAEVIDDWRGVVDFAVDGVVHDHQVAGGDTLAPLHCGLVQAALACVAAGGVAGLLTVAGDATGAEVAEAIDGVPDDGTLAASLESWQRPRVLGACVEALPRRPSGEVATPSLAAARSYRDALLAAAERSPALFPCPHGGTGQAAEEAEDDGLGDPPPVATDGLEPDGLTQALAALETVGAAARAQAEEAQAQMRADEAAARAEADHLATQVAELQREHGALTLRAGQLRARAAAIDPEQECQAAVAAAAPGAVIEALRTGLAHLARLDGSSEAADTTPASVPVAVAARSSGGWVDLRVVLPLRALTPEDLAPRSRQFALADIVARALAAGVTGGGGVVDSKQVRIREGSIDGLASVDVRLPRDQAPEALAATASERIGLEAADHRLGRHLGMVVVPTVVAWARLAATEGS